MRDIKFRAWHAPTNEMLDWQHIKVFYTIHALDPLNIIQLSLMQYTGVADKNGVGIYEGDIVQLVTSSGIRRKAKEVKWVNTPLRVGYNIGSSKNYEVIGNIYENRELLGETA